MKTCEHCAFWNRGWASPTKEFASCGAIDNGSAWELAHLCHFGGVDDFVNSGLKTSLVTSKDFSCGLWMEAKNGGS